MTGPSIARAAAALIPLTAEAQAALGGSEVRLTHFPFKVGREKRTEAWSWPGRLDRRVRGTPKDLYLLEQPEHPHISRDHFLIELVDDRFFLVDRRSLCGTVVGGAHIGGYRRGGRTELRHGDVVVVGTLKSPYVYRFDVAGEPASSEREGQ